MRCLENQGWRLHIIILIWSRSEGLSIICDIFSLQRDMNKVTDSSGLCLRASNSLRDTSTTMLKEYCMRNSSAKSLQVLCREGSSEANQRCVIPLNDKGNNIIIYVSSSLYPLIIALYNCKWIRGHSILVYLSIWHMKLNKQCCNWQINMPIPTHNSIWNMQQPHHMLNPINVGLSIICNLHRCHTRMWSSLSLPM